VNKWLIAAIIIALFVSGCTSDTSNDEETCSDTITYSNWTECNNSGMQSRIQTSYNCTANSTSVLSEFQNCTTPCVTDWVCGEWSGCNTNSNQTRYCYDKKFCSTNVNKPIDSKTCTFVNPCTNITAGILLSKCDSLVYNDVSYCNSLSSRVDECISYYAVTRNNLTACDLAEDSFIRNSCKAEVLLDTDYCDILVPANRSNCYDLVDTRLYELALLNKVISYCTDIIDNSTRENCMDSSNYISYTTFKTSLSECSDYTYNQNIVSYQTIRACYVYHITNSNVANCSTLPSFMVDDCNAMLLNNLTYCYDKTGVSRDWCLANMVYYVGDTNYCRDAASEDNCLYTLGYWFNEVDYCLKISDASKKNSCITSYVTFCQSNFNNCYPYNYCNLLTSDDDCVFNRVENIYYYGNEGWN